jgi:hypothetical protein
MPVLRKTHYPKRARLELEAQTGKRVVTGENFLPPGSAKKIRETNTE